MQQRNFIKMHGLGNDFVIVESSVPGPIFGEKQARQIADRRWGVGCDQLITIEPTKTVGADIFMRIQNTDGSEAEACGNATRCVARLMMDRSGKDRLVIETLRGLLNCWKADNDLVSVEMGEPFFRWQDVPLAEELDTLHLPIECQGLSDPVGLSVGNPHCVFFVEDAEAVPFRAVGAEIEHHALYPNRTNVQFVEVKDRSTIRQRVWERGVGVTEASGSGACAGALASMRRGLTDRSVDVHLDGGLLTITWREDNQVVMTGPTAHAFTGRLDEALLA
jgi:diaminopimelate epimerase